MRAVEEAIAMWELYRGGVIAELENIPEDKWDHAPGLGARTLRQLARHIAEAGIAFSHELTLAQPQFLRLFDEKVQKERRAEYPRAHTKQELIDLLRTTSADAAKRLRATGDALTTRTTMFMGREVTILTLLGFASAHEMYHRGQVALYARVEGLVPVLTKQIDSMLQQARA